MCRKKIVFAVMVLMLISIFMIGIPSYAMGIADSYRKGTTEAPSAAGAKVDEAIPPVVPGEGGLSFDQRKEYLLDFNNPANAAVIKDVALEFAQFATETVDGQNRLVQEIATLLNAGVSQEAIDIVVAKAGLVNARNITPGALFTVAGQKLSELEGVTDEPRLLAKLAEINAVNSFIPVTTLGKVHNFDSVTVNTVLYKEGFVVNTPEAFRDAFKALTNGETAVIIATDEDAALVAIRAALAKEGVDLLPQLGKRIVIMAVKTGSAAATAFNDLFGQENMYDLRNNRTKDILDNKKLIAGLQGAI